MEAVLSLHGRIAIALVLYYAAVGIWSLFLAYRDVAPSAGLRGAIAIAVVASIAQGTLGAIVLLFARPPRDALHVLYGAAIVLAMPLGASLAQGRSARGQSATLGLAALFTAGLAIRGIITA